MRQVDTQRLFTQAQSLLASGRLAEAETICRRLLQIDPKNSDLLNQIGLLCYRQGKLDEAERQIRRAISAGAHRADYHANLSGVLLAQRRPVDAIATLTASTVAVAPS